VGAIGRTGVEPMSALYSPQPSPRRSTPAGRPTPDSDMGEGLPRSCARSERDDAAVIETDIPARLDALPWSRFHTLVVVTLGITWILDGLEVTLTGALAGVLKENSALGLTKRSAWRAAPISGARCRARCCSDG
jgi:hypothetical protein